MKLYAFLAAPNPTRVRLYLAEKAAGGAAIPLEEVPVNLMEGEQRGAEHRARNPLGKLPVLELDDGTFLTESLAIIEYLEELHPEPSMIGRDPLERARTRELERIAEMSVLRPIAGLVHATASPLGLPPSPEVADFWRTMLPNGLAVLDTVLSDGREFLAGDAPTIADCTLQAAFQFGRIRKIEIDPDFEHLTRWDQHYREREPARQVLII